MIGKISYTTITLTIGVYVIDDVFTSYIIMKKENGTREDISLTGTIVKV